jgi:hypothetical protein
MDAGGRTMPGAIVENVEDLKFISLPSLRPREIAPALRDEVVMR